MITNDQILVESLDLIETCLKYQVKYRFLKQFADDLKQEICLQFLEMDTEKLNRIYDENHLNAYITKIIYFSINSPNSRFYKEFILPFRKSHNIEKLDFIDEET